jgi:hypothetical protein
LTILLKRHGINGLPCNHCDGYLAIQTSNNVAVCEITMLADEAFLFKN